MGYPGGPNVTTKVLHKREAGEAYQRGDAMMEAKVGVGRISFFLTDPSRGFACAPPTRCSRCCLRPGFRPCPLRPRPPPPPSAPLRRAQVKGQSERRPARPYAVARPSGHRGDWAAGYALLELHILSSLRPASPPWSRLGYILKMCFEGAI